MIHQDQSHRFCWAKSPKRRMANETVVIGDEMQRGTFRWMVVIGEEEVGEESKVEDQELVAPESR